MSDPNRSPWATDIKIGNSVHLGIGHPFVLIAGMNVIETTERLHEVAERLVNVCSSHGVQLIFKASWDKANRSSIHSYRGPGLETGLRELADIRSKWQVPIVTDIHEPWQADPVASVADLIQIPAFLCRQTNLIQAAANTSKPLLIKKMQMMSPMEARNILVKCTELGAKEIAICERGTAFGYNNLVVDPLGILELKTLRAPVVFDVTHAVQQPGGGGTDTSGRGHHVEALARAGIALGIEGLFVEVHPMPHKALCDGPCALGLDRLEPWLAQLQALDSMVKSWGGNGD